MELKLLCIGDLVGPEGTKESPPEVVADAGTVDQEQGETGEESGEEAQGSAEAAQGSFEMTLDAE